MRRTRSHPPVLLFLWSVVLSLALTADLQAQSPPPALGPTTSEDGPTREARAATAHGTLDEPAASPRLMPRYAVFQQDFARDFGVLGPQISNRVDRALALQSRIEQRWGDTNLYQWFERGVAAYSWFAATTRTERRGFDIGVDASRMAQGKLGVQMSRPLGDTSPE